ncbi:MAG: hypothetical protein LC803_12510 [Acidobacteria bacterium]|nr:hypothetical protein [Acidobacteriota bacterium]
MSERRDDTTQPGEPDAPPTRERAPQKYYDDDATGYEIYDPATDEDEDETDDGNAAETADDEPGRG